MFHSIRQTKMHLTEFVKKIHKMTMATNPHCIRLAIDGWYAKRNGCHGVVMYFYKFSQMHFCL